MHQICIRSTLSWPMGVVRTPLQRLARCTSAVQVSQCLLHNGVFIWDDDNPQSAQDVPLKPVVIDDRMQLGM